MRCTKQSVMIDTTNVIHGCLEQGGISGRVDAYNRAEVMDLIGCDPATVDEDYEVLGYDHVRARDLIERNCVGRCIRKGHVIQ